MRKPEARYRYLLNKDKYDPEVNEAVGKKKLSEKDANTISKIQEMMRAEREKKGTRNIVTSENREEFMAKKLKLGKKEEPVYEEEPDEAFPASVKHEDQEYIKTGKTGKHKKGWKEAEYDYKGNRVWAQAGGKGIRKE